jgi:hypothetical protein
MMQCDVMHDAFMRITFAPDPAVERRLRDLAAREGISLSQSVNRLLVAALDGAQDGSQKGAYGRRAAPEGAEVREAAARYNERQLHRARPLGLRTGLDPLRLKEILAELDEEDAAAKLAAGPDRD